MGMAGYTSNLFISTAFQTAAQHHEESKHTPAVLSRGSNKSAAEGGHKHTNSLRSDCPLQHLTTRPQTRAVLGV